MNFGIKLQTIRKERRMSQEALAQQLNVSRQAVSKWETGEGYPEMETLIMISKIFDVSLDYLLKEKMNDDEGVMLDEDAVVLTGPELEDFMTFKRKMAFIIGMAVAAIIVGMTITIFVDNNYGNGAFLLVVAIAVCAMIIVGMQSDKYKGLEKKRIILKTADQEKVKKEYEAFKTKFAIIIALGVFIIIAGVAMTAMFEEEMDFSPYFLWMVAFSVFLFITYGMRYDLYRQVCENKSYVEEQKDGDEESKYYAIMMPLAGVTYLALGILFNWWGSAWILFPITAILTYAYVTLKS